MLWLKRIKYKRQANEYRIIVEGLSNLIIGLLKDLGSPNDFINYPDSDDLLLTAEIQDLCELIVRYNDNMFAHSSTTLGLSCFVNLTKNYNELMKIKTELYVNRSNIDALKNVAKAVYDEHGEEAIQNHLKLKNTCENMSEKMISLMKQLHANVLSDLSSMRTAVRIEMIDVRLERDIIKDHFKGKEEHKKIELQISKINEEKEVQK